MTESTLRIAFVSGVRHAGSYLEILSADPRVTIVGVGEESDSPTWMHDDGRRVAGAAGVPWHDELESWLSPGNVDLVVVCSEPTRHARLAIACLERGLHVLVDKPVAVTLDDADRVATVAEAAGRSCSVVNRTHAPALRRLRSWIDAGYLGLPRHFDMEFLASGAFFATSVERPELVVDASMSGGGEMMNFLGYSVDAVRYASGLEVESVYAMTSNLFSQAHLENEVEDAAVLSLGLQHGVTATITLGRVPYAPGLGPTSSSLRVLGSHAHAVADDDHPALLRYGEEPVLTADSFDGGGQALRAYLSHVVTNSITGEASDYTINDARQSISVIEAAYRAAATGTPQRPR